ncbi:hypothetical protein HY251_07105 [bacterium]|nr:hypothetical protein [bacterium]
MRKIKTKGLKFKLKPVDRGPRYAIAFQGGASLHKAKEALLRSFEVNDALADNVVKAAPVVLIRDLDLDQAQQLANRLKSSGDFRVWLESASLRMKQMNLKLKELAPRPAADGTPV